MDGMEAVGPASRTGAGRGEGGMHPRGAAQHPVWCCDTPHPLPHAGANPSSPIFGKPPRLFLLLAVCRWRRGRWEADGWVSAKWLVMQAGSSRHSPSWAAGSQAPLAAHKAPPLRRRNRHP